MDLDSFKKFASESWKAIVAFVALICAQLVTRLSTEGAVIPTTTNGWLTLLGASVVGAALVYLKGQAPNDKQLDAHPKAVANFISDHGFPITIGEAPPAEDGDRQ